MSAAKHTPAGDASFRSSLLRSAVGAVGLVVLVSVAFWGIGTLGGDRGTPVATDAGPEVTAPADDPDEDDDAADDDADGDDPAADAGDPDAGDPDAGDPDAGDPDAGEGDTGDGSQDADGAADDAGDGDGDGDDAPRDVERSVAPGEVTIQVLDGFKEDGGTAADRVAALLGDAGYDIIARNDALSYEVTTVLYNPGNEAAAQQVAAELGGAEVREQPGNLSSAVALHVVVGRDRA
ncbi:LytR C-terminal domain-containing protein [Nitriliruptor alkaliphilus]|uniref:LytR C-terminal domain-containing protein n=1 Tax=Nitriliruptor alkaliphilus TaxID=427918 RepID=UPI00069843F3|nr:LytR C-terminal domain-containing protein [Nitriliruptor alkaliphilus]